MHHTSCQTIKKRNTSSLNTGRRRFEMGHLCLMRISHSQKKMRAVGMGEIKKEEKKKCALPFPVKKIFFFLSKQKWKHFKACLIGIFLKAAAMHFFFFRVQHQVKKGESSGRKNFYACFSYSFCSIITELFSHMDQPKYSSSFAFPVSFGNGW